MNTSFKKLNGRFATVLAVSLTALTLAACGGGGGGGDTPHTPTSFTESVTCPDGTTKSATASTSSGAVEAAILACPGIDATKVVITPADKATAVSPDVIAASGITVATSSVLSTPSATDVTVSAGGTNVPGTVTMMTGAKGFKFTPSGKLLYGQTYTFAASIKDTLSKALVITSSFTTASVTCTAPQVPNVAGDACETPTTLHYTDKVYAIWTMAYPYAVTKTGVTKVINKTQYTVGFAPLSNCWIAEKQLSDGKILVNCQDATGGGRHVLYINPEKDEMYDYVGNVPTDIVWHDVTPLNLVRHQSGWDSQAKTADGWYYTIGTGNWVLRFLDEKTGTSTIVKEGVGQVDGNINYLSSYTN